MDIHNMWTGLVVFITVTLFGRSTASVLSLPCTSSSTYCGQPVVEPSALRIIGGQEVQIGAWPWMVSLLEEGYPSCGGAIISETFVLTATHCLYGESNDPKRWQVLAGNHNLDRMDPGQKIVQVRKIILHPDYDNMTIAHDIALLLLEEPLTFSTLIQPLCLPTADQGVSTGEPCLLAGWGATRGTADQNKLNQVLLPIISDDVCAQPDWYWTDFIPATTFCAGYEAGEKDACHGDSGGPLICKRAGRWFSQGVASWGYGCAEYKWPGIYTDVSKYTQWILDNMQANTDCGGIIG